MMRIFLTGASGFIGSRILPALQTTGEKVMALA
ncbi:NAD-dependent epimerase/dehydratase family protein, partial [Klebsiella pneumoniae]